MLIVINDGLEDTASIAVEKYTNVNFVADDGRVIFNLRIDENGILTVRAVDFTVINGSLRSNSLVVRPNVSNQVQIWTGEHK